MIKDEASKLCPNQKPNTHVDEEMLYDHLRSQGDKVGGALHRLAQRALAERVALDARLLSPGMQRKLENDFPELMEQRRDPSRLRPGVRARDAGLDQALAQLGVDQALAQLRVAKQQLRDAKEHQEQLRLEAEHHNARCDRAEHAEGELRRELARRQRPLHSVPDELDATKKRPRR